MILYYLSASCNPDQAPKAKEETHTSTHICEDIEIGKAINYNANINVNNQFCKIEQNAEVEIELVDGFKDDKLTLDVSCEKCNCREPPKPNSAICNGVGRFECGGCYCKWVFNLLFLTYW